MNNPYFDILFSDRGITLKRIQELSKGKKYPYKEVAEKLDKLTDLSQIDSIIGEAERTSMKMVGIKKLYRMVKNPVVKEKMMEMYFKFLN